MSFPDFLDRLTVIFDDIGLDYMIVGSLASTLHGIGRSTQDIDIVVELTLGRLQDLLAALSPDQYYVSDAAAGDAIRGESQFNIIDMETGWKADLVIRKRRPFSIEEFHRRQPAVLFGKQLYVASAEDTIIAKLEWAMMGQSERHLRDIAGILQVKGESLDTAYIDHWVAALGLAASWAHAQRLADEEESSEGESPS